MANEGTKRAEVVKAAMQGVVLSMVAIDGIKKVFSADDHTFQVDLEDGSTIYFTTVVI